MAQQGEARHIGAGVNPHLAHEPRGRGIESLHGCDGLPVGLLTQLALPSPQLLYELLRAGALLHEVGDDPRSQLLGEDYLIPGPGPRVGNHLSRVHDSRRRNPVFGLRVLYAVPPGHDRPRLEHLAGPALEDSAQGFDAHGAGVAHDVEGGHRAGAHGVQVAQGVSCGYLAEDEGVVDDGREDVHGLHYGQVFPELIHTAIVPRTEPVEEVGVLCRGQPFQSLQ